MILPVVLARVDDRLIHGQVVEGWAPFVHADTIVVVSDTVCLQPDRCRLMELIVPDHIRLKVVSVGELGEFLQNAGATRILLLFAGLEDVLSVLEEGVTLSNINVGNLHNLRGGTEVTPSVFLNRKDLETIRLLVQKGVDIEAREVPDGVSTDLAGLIRGPGADQ